MSSGSPIARDCNTCGAAEAPALTHRGVVIGRVCDRCVDGLIADAGDTSSDEENDNVATTESEKNASQCPEGGTSGGAGKEELNASYNSNRQKSTERGIEHACSWRETYQQMGVDEVGHR
jgi:hypothetical protein